MTAKDSTETSNSVRLLAVQFHSSTDVAVHDELYDDTVSDIVFIADSYASITNLSTLKLSYRNSFNAPGHLFLHAKHFE